MPSFNPERIPLFERYLQWIEKYGIHTVEAEWVYAPGDPTRLLGARAWSDLTEKWHYALTGRRAAIALGMPAHVDTRNNYYYGWHQIFQPARNVIGGGLGPWPPYPHGTNLSVRFVCPEEP